MEFTQPTQPQTQPTQQSPLTQDSTNDLDKNIICRLICTTGQYNYFDLSVEDLSPDSKSRVWTFGRNQDCDFLLTSCTRLSNRHFKLWFNQENKTVWIQDTSTNGTNLNGHRLVKGSNYILNQGDEIAVGVGVPKDVVKFVVLFADQYNPSKSSQSQSAYKDEQGILKDFIIKNEVIGQGAFATVKKVIERSSGKSYAVKIINRRKALNTSSAVGGVDRELSILRKLNHPNIVYLKSFYEDMDNYYLVMEFVPGGDLMDFVAANGAIGEDACQVITKQILDGIAYVHKMGISHRDLKPDNILIMQDDPILVKITDFGLAKISDNATFMKTFCGTLAYLAPEVISGKYEHQQHHVDPKTNARSSNYSCLVDIWSLGCLVYVLLTSHLPFNGKTQEQMFQKIQSGEYHESPLNSYKISKNARDFLNCCLQVNPRLRFSASEALKHVWLAGVDSVPDDDSQEGADSQKVISLSQSQSQQSRKNNNGSGGEGASGIFNMSMSKIDEDIMKRPLVENKKTKANEFKIPKRVIPLPQSQQPLSQQRQSQPSQPHRYGAGKPNSQLPDSIPEDEKEHLKLTSSNENSPDLGIPMISKYGIKEVLKRKHSLDDSGSSGSGDGDVISPSDRKRIKPQIIDKVDLSSLNISQRFGGGADVPQTSNIWSQDAHQEASNGIKMDNNDTTSNESEIPIDTFMALVPLSQSLSKKPIYIRQGVNPFSIGRHESCDIFINDDRMSKIHCLFNKKRHPVLELSIYESPAHCLDDVWLLDCSTNSCLVNGVILGKGRKVQLFDGDKVEFFNDSRSEESIGYSVKICDSTGLFNSGERTADMDHKFVNVIKQDFNDAKLRPRIHESSAESSELNGKSNKLSATGPFIANAVNQARPQRKSNEQSKLSIVSGSQTKRADLKVGQERPTNSWI
ncbi:serine/threonine-protein kinase Rad53p [[Candida] railenensis]|uniref:Serine/threonine-protein kinase Rad53p n=1 Tax=[Candida] railenensis TaxID=45579 RepID=A0A9P0QTJ8_9ASCO|nr:serine/threonine-protein kinase Rad53p [[Candida] railenensis]